LFLNAADYISGSPAYIIVRWNGGYFR